MIQNIDRRTVIKATGLAAILGIPAEPGRAELQDESHSSMAPDEHGPQRSGKFVVEIDGENISGIQRVDLPRISFEQGSYREGNEAPQEKKVAGQPTYDDLEMERGVKIGDTTVWDWVNNIRHGKVDGSRRDIAVVVQDTEGNAQTRWEFTQSLPTNYEPPDLDASADGEVATESLTVTFDKMIRAE